MTTNDFNFDRCLKFVFTGGNIGAGNSFVVEYNPRKASYLCPKLEATIVDTPASTLSSRPGYEAELKIYNPNHDILSVIASGITLISKAKDAYEYYRGKVMVDVYAGYYREGPTTSKDSMPDKTDEQNIVVKNEVLLKDADTYGEHLFRGYVNNSILVHKGTDNILTLACHNIDLTKNQFNQISSKIAKDARTLDPFSPTMDQLRYKPDQKSFDSDFRWLVSHLSALYYPSNVRGLEMSPVKEPIPPYYNRESLNPGWFKIYYVTSLSDFEAASSTLEGLETDRSFWDENLRVRATDPNNARFPLRYKGFYTLKSSLESALEELCAFSGEHLGYKAYDKFGYVVYCIYKRGNRKNTVNLNTGGLVKIINFQNLLETPSVSPSGSMKINMWFNKDCKCWKYIALVLDSEYTGSQEDTGVLNINKLNFFTPEGQNTIVPLGGSTSNAAIATTQLSTSMPVAAAAHYKEVASKEGYMFNVGFLMTKVTHKLSTHGKNWSTTVQTVPMIMGVKE